MLIRVRWLFLTLMISLTATAADHATATWQVLGEHIPLPVMTNEGHIEHLGASIWFASVGKGPTVILLHGGLANSDSWGNQLGPLIDSHHQVILIDSRGHGRSTLGVRPLTYELMESDVIAVMDALHIQRAAVVGWSDGAIISLIIAMKDPARVSRIYAFGANMDRNSLEPGASTSPLLSELATRLAADYARVSPTPDRFAALHSAVEAMQQTEPNYTAAQLAAIRGPNIAIADGDHDEFITRAHTNYLARTIPGAKLILLHGVSHFAPWQAPSNFNRSLLSFLNET